jgi:hypothetical protein
LKSNLCALILVLKLGELGGTKVFEALMLDARDFTNNISLLKNEIQNQW